ncbi:hypothetical protein JCM10908_001337 [Rhodotorula pacifica]|uniref:uncharacterized protein n=1 Tax=Rhodotorula pacifica TaxID=1495444 RepID=UPI00316C875D
MATATETLSIVDSLYQSRETLLYHTFTPFASLAHSPHTLVQLTSPSGRGCTVSIGPHAFLNTHVYLCDWKPPGSQTSPPPPPSAASAASPAPLSAAAITPTLVAALNAASQSDKKLAETLRKAATGEASADELAGLATFIDHLRRQEELAAANPPLPPADPAAPPSLVLDFAETRSTAAATAASSSRAAAPDRRVVLPAHFVLTPLPPRNQNPMRPALFHDVLLSLFIFPSELSPPQSARGKQRLFAAPEADFNAPVPVDIVVEGCDQRILDGLWRAARNGRPRDDQLERWARQMINSVPHRTHILHIPPAVAAAAAAEAALAASDDPTPSAAGMSRSASQTGLVGAGGAGGSGTPSGSLAGTKRGVSARESPAAVLATGTKRQRTLAASAAATASPAPSSSKPPPTKRGSRTSAVRAGSATASTPGASSPAAGPSRALDGTSSGILSLDQSPAPSSPGGSAGGPTKRGRGKGKGAKGKGKGGKGKRKSIFRVGSEDDDESEEEVVLTGGSRRRAAVSALD